MNGHLLPWFLECELASGFKCSSCGRSGQALYVRSPAWKKSGLNIELSYPLRCGACGKASSLRLNLPLLLLGYILVWSEFYANRRRNGGELCIKPCKADTFATLCSEFSRTLAQYGGSVAGLPSDSDRIQFGFSQQEWTDFEKRLGCGGGEEIDEK